ncbi:hypothetical protein L1987_06818 [Smallanthus sonchifolius]|uniref:Uncharacterized protein n=1 Tax=Smallanthus sonchifolius TaxID=185202 RepID=A0ACB9JZ72_9ASTR|nr:hypothetical protein L1987_06818 [Smallanthus sonchifolius]
MISVFIGISLLAPDDSKGGEVMDSPSSKVNTDVESLLIEELPSIKDMKSLARAVATKATAATMRANSTCTLLLGIRGGDLSKLLSLRNPSGWNRISVVEKTVKYVGIYFK